MSPVVCSRSHIVVSRSKPLDGNVLDIGGQIRKVVNASHLCPIRCPLVHDDASFDGFEYSTCHATPVHDHDLVVIPKLPVFHTLLASW
jgi:hypothetical protein